MKPGKFVISGTGCALGDFLYNGTSINYPHLSKYLSQQPGDGGLSPGKLVFTEELEKFSGCNYYEILKDITGNRDPDAFNVGGPSLVSLIHASQMLDPTYFEVRFFGITGNDDTAPRLREIVRKTPLNTENYIISGTGTTPFTDVFCDPGYSGETGERTFVNNIGVAGNYGPEHLNDSFFRSDIVCFGGTALVPRLHDNLTTLLFTARQHNCTTIVNTVFDFRNEKANPGLSWPLGKTSESLPLIDILIMNCDEAMRISGQPDIMAAAAYFASSGVSSFIITNGSEELYAMSDGRLFGEMKLRSFPVSGRIYNELRANPLRKGDTTGCGDNFAGSIIASLAQQIKNKKRKQPDLSEAVSWGVAAGGFTCCIIGGTFIEKYQGEKLKSIIEIQEEYRRQIT